MRFPDKQIRSVGDLLEELNRRLKPKESVWFRGHSNKSWPLVPSIARSIATLAAERAYVKHFMQNAFAYIGERPRTEWEWIFTMQHHRAPTRLLDWSESPLTALYFIVTARPRVDGALWCLDPVELNKKANIRFDNPKEIPLFGMDRQLDNYLPSSVGSEKLTNFTPVAALAERNTRRIEAQLGTFTIVHREAMPIEKVGDGSHVWRLIVPKAAKARIRDELARLKVSEFTVFPDLDRVAAAARELLE